MDLNVMETLSVESKFEQYQKMEGVNWSVLKHFFRSPAHVRAYMEEEQRETGGMRLGTLQHMAVLEPERFKAECVAAPDFGHTRKHDASGTTKEQGAANKKRKQEWEAANAGKTVISAAEFAKIKAMSAAVWKHKEAAALLRSALDTEFAVQWVDRETGLKCKCLLDIVTGTGAVVDIKTTHDATYPRFSKTASSLHYHCAAAYYLRGARAAGLGVSKFVWIVIESEAPHCVLNYYLPRTLEDTCNEVIDSFLRRYNYCQQAGVWDGYNDPIQPLEVPEWYVRSLSNSI